jgi:hypothetical protein
MDVTELILHDHDDQRRMFAILDEIDPADHRKLGAVWARLAILLEVHADAEERLFYPRLLDVGDGAGGEKSASSETKDAIHDHNEIRDAVREVRKHEVSSEAWWAAVTEARTANSNHMAEEERGALADFRRTAGLTTRHDLGVEFAAFEAEHASGVRREDQDPEGYVARNA